MDDPVQTLTPPHVLIFPLPAQGHVNSMLKLAELLCLSDFHVTFLVSDHIHNRLLRQTNVHRRFEHYPRFRFETISDGIPTESSRSGSDFLTELIDSLRTVIKPLFRELFCSNRLSYESTRPVTCIIADGVLSFTIDVAEEMGIPIVYFRTISACAFWAYFCIPQLIESGDLPFKGIDLDVPIQSIPGMEDFLRRRDLPANCRVSDLSNKKFQFLSTETRQTPRARALILNTFDDLEGPILSHIRIHMPNIYTIGPLHAHNKPRMVVTSTSSDSLLEEDHNCMMWLDAQPSQSVIYISFGSLAMITRTQLMEFWHGVVKSGKRFLWVIRPDLVSDGGGVGQIPTELLEATMERGHVVEWAPQEEVLDHQAIGGFLTHSGWNSTLESIVAGVPMICWPYIADQQMNSRYVGEVWKLGMDMKDTCDRIVVEKMIRDLMEVRKSEFVQSTKRMAKLARKATSEGGSSHCNLDRLIKDLRLMSAGV
ncbi:7-deoxyloganetic acid glucosyltransferase-like [Camellia sinensis]|uniref:Glycosyltransferase n=1 Tax=Camellia sinensis var. sinensis TaxID=542762 RepID=A0A4S4EYD4_CAMSN|nr:7-deoxyloganetic acid glucosyltransferase-like [Camellia sinensis]THG21624.1 hypothetical protein TEA_007692 [Camellia sinensis var. sinensis]